MAKKVSKTVIGGFVISAIALLIIGVIVFGGGEYFKETRQAVMVFEGSVKGLKVGSPVVFRGVQIGAVKEIILSYDIEKLEVEIPVIVEIEPDRFAIKGSWDDENAEERNRRLIDKGLRAQLTIESLVTGQLMVLWDFFPDTPVNLTGIEMGLVEIPTIPTDFEKLAKALENLPIEELVEKLLSAVEGVDNLINSEEVKNSLSNLELATENLNKALVNADKLVVNVDNQVQPLSGDLQATMGDARKLLQIVDNEVKPISTKAQDALVSARKALDQAEVTLSTFNDLAGERSEVRDKLNLALDEIAGAARSVKSLMDYLERHPEALLQGKSGSGGN